MSKKYTTNFLEDTNGSTGSANQVLVSTSTGVDWVDGSGSGIIGGPYLPLSAGSSYPLTGKLYVGQGIEITGGSIAQATAVLHTNNIIYFRGGSSGLFLQNGDGSDGIYISNDSIRFDQAGGEKMRLASNGNVGIGTTSPYNKTHIRTSVDGDGLLLECNNGNNNKYVGAFFKVDNNTSDSYKKGALVWERTGSYNEGRFHFLLNNDDNASNVDLTDSKVTILSTGNVGIGTTTPAYPLEVAGTDTVSLAYQRTGVSAKKWGFHSDNSNTYWQNLTDNILAFTLSNAGNVGIGTTSPGTKLHVGGTAKITGDTALGTTSSAYLQMLRAGANYIDASNASGYLRFRTGGSIDRMTIDSVGNVGIGTTSPSYTLDVDGGINSASLYVNAVAQNSSIRYSAPNNKVSFARTSTSDEWFKIIDGSGSPATHRISITSAGDNTNMADEYLVNTAGYGMYMHIQRLPGVKYNTSKLVAIAAVNPSDGGSTEVWIKLLGMSSGSGITVIASNTTLRTSAEILASATTTAPTLTINDTQLDITTNSRNNATLMTSRGATFGSDVGVGTTAPQTRLHIQEGNSNILIGSDDTYGQNYSAIGFGGLSNGNNRIFAGYDGSSVYDDMYYAAGTGKGHQFRVNGAGSTSMSITSGGNVGIGTTSPSQKLDVSGPVNSTDYRSTNTLYLTSDGDDSGSNPIIFRHGASGERARITSAGNVGIGTTSPGAKLDVVGDLKVSLGAIIGNVNTSSSPTNYESILRIKGKNNYNDGTTWYGDYGQIILHSNTNSTSGARRFMITNALDNTKFAIVRSVDADTDPSVNSTANSVNSGTADFVIDNTGNVGIGTTSPQYPLHVAGSSSVNAPTGNGVLMGLYSGTYGHIQMNGSAGSYIDFSQSGVDHKGRILYDNTSNYFRLDTNGGEKMRITSGGNVGIGTTAPLDKLHVHGGDIRIDGGSRHLVVDHGTLSGGSGVILKGTGSNLPFVKWDDGTTQIAGIRATSSGDLRIQTNGFNDRLVINSSGNVGIGTTAPTNRLDVVGNASVSSLRVGSSASGEGIIRYNPGGGNGIGIVTGALSSSGIGLFVSHQNNNRNVGIGTTAPKTKLDINGHFCVDSKTHSITDTFTTCLTVNLSNHTGCHVVITAFGDWGSHSSAAYRGEFFLQNGANGYSEPGIILRQDDNTSDGTDQIICQIVDPASTANPKDFEIQIRHTDTVVGGFSAQFTYTVQGQFNSIT